MGLLNRLLLAPVEEFKSYRKARRNSMKKTMKRGESKSFGCQNIQEGYQFDWLQIRQVYFISTNCVLNL